MKKLIIYIFTIVIIFSCSKENKKENSLSNFNLKGSVKSVSTKAPGGILIEKRIYNIKGNQVERKIGKGRRIIDKYDVNDNLIARLIYNTNDRDLKRKLIYKYDDNGNQIERITYDSNETIEEKYIYKYDSNGNKIEDVKWYKNSNSESLLNTYKYDRNGNITEQYWHRNDGSVRTTNIYKYDRNGNLIEANYNNNYSDKSRVNDTKYIYKYDDNGNKIESNKFDYMGNLLRKFTNKYEYDDKGNWIIKRDFSYNIIDSKMLFDGFQTRKITYFEDKIKAK